MRIKKGNRVLLYPPHGTPNLGIVLEIKEDKARVRFAQAVTDENGLFASSKWVLIKDLVLEEEVLK